jgi:hypothetical protein
MVRIDIVGQYRAVLGRLAVMFRGGLCSALAVGVAVLLVCGRVQAQLSYAALSHRKLSEYEQRSIELALKRVKGEEDPAPGGKRVESIEIVALDMIDDRDFLPNFLNVFHYTTRDYVIRREVLLKTGQPYDISLAYETESNLRALPQLTIVLVVPLKGSKPDSVRVLVVTKDVLSLRMEWEPRFVNGKLDYLSLQPSEQNVLGTHHVVAGLLRFTTHSYAVGGSLYFPRIAGSRISASLAGGAVLNCDTNKVEGHFGSFSYGQPLYSTRAKWAWVTGMSWSKGVQRPTTAGEWICSGGTEQQRYFRLNEDHVVGIPYRYNSNSQSGSATITRSFGVRNKYNISFGAEATRTSITVDEPQMDEVHFASDSPDDDVFDPTPRAPDDAARERAVTVNVFRSTLSRGETRINPFVQLAAFSSVFRNLLNYETLGMQEDNWLGHNLSLKVYPALRAWGSSRNLFGTVSSLGYTLPVDNGFLRAAATSYIEISASNQSSAATQGDVRFVTPDSGGGRVVVASQYIRRSINYLNQSSSLGGTGRLRGYKPDSVWGRHLTITNIEYRSPPIQVLSVFIGGALFYDVGDAFGSTICTAATPPVCSPEKLKLKSGAGAGLRFAFPQLQRAVFRLDAGFPLTRADEAEVTVIGVFNQAI